MGDTRRRTETYHPFLLKHALVQQGRTHDGQAWGGPWWREAECRPSEDSPQRKGIEMADAWWIDPLLKSSVKNPKYNPNWSPCAWETKGLASCGEAEKTWFKNQCTLGSIPSHLCSDLPALPSHLSNEAQRNFLSLSSLKQASDDWSTAFGLVNFK